MEIRVGQILQVTDSLPNQEANFPPVRVFNAAAAPYLSDVGLTQHSKKGFLAPFDKVEVTSFSTVGWNTRVCFRVVSISTDYRKWGLIGAVSFNDTCYIDVLNDKIDVFPEDKFYAAFKQVP